MTTFDGSIGATANTPPTPVSEPAGFSALDLLTQTVAERIDITSTTVYAPGGRIRLECHTNIPERELRKWQRMSLSPEKRKSGNANPLDSSQLTIAIATLNYTTLRLEVLDKRDNETWRVVDHDGEPLTFSDDALLRAFGAMDTASALIRIFGRESDVVRASQEVLAESGWTGENGGDPDDDPR